LRAAAADFSLMTLGTVDPGYMNCALRGPRPAAALRLF
jgi:hypothetical protein